MDSLNNHPRDNAAGAATVTRLLDQVSAGDGHAAASLLPLVYD
jgi:hypothetical protein